MRRKEGRDDLSHLRESIHRKWQWHEDYVLGHKRTALSHQLYGALDALWDTDHALRGVYQELPADERLAKLASYGLLQALIIQQDAVENLVSIVLGAGRWNPRGVDKLQEIRRLRHRLAGHPAYARDAGKTTSIIDVRDRTCIAGSIYGLDRGAGAEKFPRILLRELIDQNAASLIQPMSLVDAELDDCDTVFKRLEAQNF